jgi:predicted nucleic acid-binding protein
MILVDTNVLARGIERGHKHQIPALHAMRVLRIDQNEEIVIVPQVLVELYAICTRTQNGVGLTPDEALGEIVAIKDNCRLFGENPAVFSQWEMLVRKYKPKNRQVFDMRLVAAMLVHQIPAILTFNDEDFRMYAEIRALNPFDVLGIPRV